MSKWFSQAPMGIVTAVVLTLVLMPIGVAAWFYKWPVGTIFWLNLVAIVPESFIIGVATEELALHFGDAAGALLNASFGNAVELIFVLLTLQDGLTNVCAGSLVGSILSNHLVLLGCAFLVGGVLAKPPYKIRLSNHWIYNQRAALDQAQQLLVASFSVTMPAVFANLQQATPEHVLALSKALSFALVFSYIALIYHQLKSPVEKLSPNLGGEKARLSACAATVMLLAGTVPLAISSKYMVHSVDDFCSGIGLSQTFVGVVLLPVAGDFSHCSAIYFAMLGKMDLAINIALASAIQIALVVVPFSVGVGHMMGVPMVLGFQPMHAVTLMISAVITFAVLVDGVSNWLRGYTLLTTFLMVCLVIFFMPDEIA